jgi:Flp pilus assembly protein TadG
MSFVSNRTSQGRLGRAGATSLELALVLIPFLLLMFGTFDLARYFFTVQAIETLTTDAARYAVINGNAAVTKPSTGPYGPLGIDIWASQTNVPVPALLDPTQGTICIAYGATVAGLGVNRVQVTVVYPFTAMLPGLGALNTTLQTTQPGLYPCDAMPPADMLADMTTVSY